MKKKIAVFTGYGMNTEIGIGVPPFEVISKTGWDNNTKKAYDYYNELEKTFKTIKPSAIHLKLALLEFEYDVTIVTHALDDLHERAGSSNVIHIRGDVTEMRTIGNPEILYKKKKNLKYNDIGTDGFTLRPNVVLQDEKPYNAIMALDAFLGADVRIIIGTSCRLRYIIPMVFSRYAFAKPEGLFINPNPPILRQYGMNDTNIEYCRKKASNSIEDIDNYIKKICK